MSKYKVQKGDNLTKIAKMYNLTLDELMKLNNISAENANNIQIGQELNVNADNQPFIDKNYRVPRLVFDPGQDGTTLNQRPRPLSQPITQTLQPKSVDQATYLKNNAKTVQQQLLNLGYNLGNYGADGKWGNTSQAAFDQAIKDGYSFKNGVFISNKPILKPKTPPRSLEEAVQQNPSYQFKQMVKQNPELVKKQNPNNIAYVNFSGYKAYGVIPTGHAGVIIKSDDGTYTYYDYGAKHTSGSGFTRMNPTVSANNTDYRKVVLGKNLSEQELGDALGKYFPDNNDISFYWQQGNANDAIKYLTERSKTNHNNYNTFTNNCSSEAECAMKAAGVDFNGSIINLPAWNTPSNSEVYNWHRTLTQDELNNQQQLEQNLNTELQSAQQLYDEQYKNKSAEEIRQIALSRSRNNTAPNANFMTAVDMRDDKKMPASRNATNSYSNCINTVTGFFNPTQTVSSNISFTQTPWAYGFQEINEADATPGDVGILHNTDDHPYHAVILDNQNSDGTWNVNYSNGDKNYRKNKSINVFKSPDQKHKLKQIKYYRYVGNNNGPIDKAVQFIAPGLRFMSSVF